MNLEFTPHTGVFPVIYSNLHDLGKDSLRMQRNYISQDPDLQNSFIAYLHSQEASFSICTCKISNHPLLKKYTAFLQRKDSLLPSYNKEINFTLNPWKESLFPLAEAIKYINFFWQYLGWQISQIYHYKSLELFLLEQTSKNLQSYEDQIQYAKECSELVNLIHNIQHVLLDKLSIHYPLNLHANRVLTLQISKTKNISEIKKLKEKIASFTAILTFNLNKFNMLPIAQEIFANISAHPQSELILWELQGAHLGIPSEISDKLPEIKHLRGAGFSQLGN